MGRAPPPARWRPPFPNLAVETPYDLLCNAVRLDAGRLLVTYYDDATGERVELSVATFDNWVARPRSVDG